MMNNIIQNIVMSRLSPENRMQFENFQRSALQSGNPEQYMMQQLGNNPVFQKVMDIRRNKTQDEFYKYLGNISNNGNPSV